MKRRLVGRIDAGEIWQLPGSRSLVKTLDVAFFGDFQRCVHVDLDETAGSGEFARGVTTRAKRRNGGHQDDHANVVEEASEFPDATNVLHSVGVTKAEITIQAVPKRVTVKVVHGESPLAEAFLDDQRDR
jgi:hypothetical protein